MSNGTWVVQGTQYGLPSGASTNLGPFNVAFGDVISTQLLEINTELTVLVPYDGTTYGVWLIPSGSEWTNPAVGIKFSTVSYADGGYISLLTPTFWAFDTVNDNVPDNIYLVGDSVTWITVQFV